MRGVRVRLKKLGPLRVPSGRVEKLWFFGYLANLVGEPSKWPLSVRRVMVATTSLHSSSDEFPLPKVKLAVNVLYELLLNLTKRHKIGKDDSSFERIS